MRIQFNVSTVEHLVYNISRNRAHSQKQVWPMAKNNMKIATFIALLHLLCGHNALNLTVATVSVQHGCCHFYVLRIANGQPVCYSGTPLNGHPSTVDTYDITDTFKCPECFSICFNTLATPE